MVNTELNPARLNLLFDQERIVKVEHFLPESLVNRMQDEAVHAYSNAERSYIPGHKQGATLSYESIHYDAPTCLAVYHSDELIRFLERITGEHLMPTADHDQSSCSLLYYKKAGDHINWHFDLNFYQGRHFTVLIALKNRSAGESFSAGRLMRKKNNKEVEEINTPVNTLVIFEGAEVLHKATPIEQGDERIMLSMTYCTNPRINLFKEIARRIKDTAFYGMRVIFD
jgi:hypothetical protein